MLTCHVTSCHKTAERFNDLKWPQVTSSDLKWPQGQSSIGRWPCDTIQCSEFSQWQNSSRISRCFSHRCRFDRKGDIFLFKIVFRNFKNKKGKGNCTQFQFNTRNSQTELEPNCHPGFSSLSKVELYIKVLTFPRILRDSTSYKFTDFVFRWKNCIEHGRSVPLWGCCWFLTIKSHPDLMMCIK